MAVRLEKTTDGSNKFWEIKIEHETETEVSYGAIGAKPRLSHKDHGSAEKAEKFMTSQINKKKKEGYVEATATDATEEPASKKPKVESTGDLKSTRLEDKSDGHMKFWEIEVHGSKTIVKYGAIDGTPRTQEKVHASAADARKFAAKMIGSKKKKGYQEVGGGADGVCSGDDGTLYTFGEAVTPFELEERRDDWDTSEVMDCCKSDIKHGVMKDAPAVAKAVAEKLHSSMPDLEDIPIVTGSSGSDGGEVIVISCTGGKKSVIPACLKGLKFTKEFLDNYEKKAQVEQVDFKETVKYGFNLVKSPGFSGWDEAKRKDYTEGDRKSVV